MNNWAREFILISCSPTACQDTLVAFGVLHIANYLPKYFSGCFQIYKLVVRLLPSPLSLFKMWYFNFIHLLWLQKDSTSRNTFLCLDWKRLISKIEVAHAKYHSCKYKKKGEGGEESKASTVDLKILITANILAGKLISQNIYANKRSSSTTRASVI